MQIINKKIYLIFLISIIAIFIKFCFEVSSLQTEQSTNARKFLFDKPINIYSKNYLFLDGYHTEVNFRYIDYCKLKKMYLLEDFKNVAYRYPNTYTVTKFYSYAYEERKMINQANQLFLAYKITSNSKLKQVKLKTCQTSDI